MTRQTPKKKRPPKKAEHSLAAVLLAAYRKANPERAEIFLSTVPPELGEVFSAAIKPWAEFFQALGDAARAAECGDVEGCAEIFRRLFELGEELNRTMDEHARAQRLNVVRLMDRMFGNASGAAHAAQA